MHAPEEGARANTFLRKTAHRFFGIESDFIFQYQSIYPIDVVGIIGAGKRTLNEFDVFKQLVVTPSDPALDRDHLIEPLCLGNSQRGLQIGHSRVPSELLVKETLLR